MSRALDDLTPRFRPLACELLARCVEAGIAVMIVDTLRTPAEHQQNLANGTSWTPVSKHLDARSRGLPFAGSDAIDICLYESYALHGPDKLQWNAKDPAWLRVGQIGESLGLRWGGRWKTPDLGHFEFVTPTAPAQDARA